MDGRTSVLSQIRRNSSKRAFTLIEILVVVVIMASLVGVVGSILTGYMDFYWATKDQSAASRKAQDVFNALDPVILNAGLGIPETTPGDYFYGSAPVKSWASPLFVTSCDVVINPGTGNVLKALYSVRSGFKNGSNDMTAFSSENGGSALVDVSPPVTTPLIGSQADKVKGTPGHLPYDTGFGNDYMTSYVTFPGAYMHPLKIVRFGGVAGNIILIGKRATNISADLLPFHKNHVHPYHDMYLVRAAVAFVDANSTFNVLNLTNKDFADTGFDAAALSGIRIGGIKAVRFERAPDNSSITVRVLAEGDVVNSQRIDTTGAVAAKWTDITLDKSRHYEEFTKTWRTRNIK